MLTPEMRELVLNAEQSALVFGRPDTDEKPLLVIFDELTDAQYASAAMQAVTSRKLTFAGILAIMPDGKPLAKCSASVESIAIMIGAVSLFARNAVEQIKAQQSDAVEWLEKLFALPDERTS